MSTVHVVQLLTGLPDLLSLSAVWGRTNRNLRSNNLNKTLYDVIKAQVGTFELTILPGPYILHKGDHSFGGLSRLPFHSL